MKKGFGLAEFPDGLLNPGPREILHPPFRERWVRDSDGFTLIELLVVMVIIGLLAALVGPKLFGQVDKARQHDAQAQIELFGQALDMYRLERHKYPTSEEGLEALRDYLKKNVPKDPWGNDYVYRSPGEHGEYDLMSFGADGSEGGSGNDLDIVSWKALGQE